MFSIRTSAVALACAMVVNCTVLPRTGSGSGSGSSAKCSKGSTLCCTSETTDDLLAGVGGTLESVSSALLSGGAIESCERIGSDTPCAVQPLCCQLGLATAGSFLLGLSCSEINANA